MEMLENGINFPISCKNCIHNKELHSWNSCKLGKGVFKKSARFIECDKYEEKERFIDTKAFYNGSFKKINQKIKERLESKNA